MSYKPQNIMITGGAGFIGANYIQYLLDHYPDIAIFNIDKLTYAGCLDNLTEIAGSPRYKFYKNDICDQPFIENLIRENNIDTVVHFAAESHVDRSIAGPAVFIQTNIIGTFSLLEAVKKVWLEEKKLQDWQCRFHHVSTDEVYGTLTKTDPAFSEHTPYAPNSPYSASKASSDHLVRAYHHTYGLPTTLSNCSNNYGPFQHQEKLIPTIIRCCLDKKPIPIYGDGSNIRDWLYVEDHCSAIDLIIQEAKNGETYTIGGNAERTNLELTQLICAELAKITQIDASEYLNLINFVKDRPGHDWRYAINTHKIESELSWKQSYHLEEGLSKTIQWYIKAFDYLCVPYAITPE